MKTALIIGATGLVGSQLLDLLIKDDHFDKVKVFARRSTDHKNNKLEEFLVDFGHPEKWAALAEGDVLFSSLGTTLKVAGSQEKQYEIDYTYQYSMAEIAVRNGVGAFVLVSSAGANARSKIFYSRMKGELEDAVKKLPFRQISILQPGILDGNRKEPRPMEKFSITIARGLKNIPGLKKYRPIHAEIVARAMINAALTDSPGIKTFTLGDVFTLAGI